MAARSLATLTSIGVSGASAAAGMSDRDAAKVLATTNPARRNKTFDALLRQAHQPTLRREGDALLLLQVLGSDQSGVASRAKAAFSKTVRGRVVANLAGPDHFAFKASATLALVLTASYWAVRAVNLRPGPPAGPVDAFFRYAVPPVLWNALKVAILATVVSAVWSAFVVLRSLIPASTRAKLAPELKLGAVTVTVVAAAIAALWYSAPLVFVAASLLTVYGVSFA